MISGMFPFRINYANMSALDIWQDFLHMGSVYHNVSKGQKRIKTETF